MNFQFTNPLWLWLLPPALAWTLWLALKSDVQVSAWRKWLAFAVRCLVLLCLILSMAGFEWLRPIEGMNAFFLLDRSESIPSPQQEMAREYVNKISARKKSGDKAGVVVFGGEASIEFAANPIVSFPKVLAIVPTERTDIAAAIRLGSAAFPENGQKRLVLLSDGNENLGDALGAVMAAKPLGVTVDVVPLGAKRGNDVSVQKVVVPNTLKKGQTFEAKIFAVAEHAQTAKVRLYRNERYLGEQQVSLEAGKNLFTFPQTLTEPGFYSYDVLMEAPQDAVAQNNRASAFTRVQGDPRVLVISSDPTADSHLVEAIQSVQVDVKVIEPKAMPATLGELQSYDAIVLSNVAAGDLGRDGMKLLESAVRDFGVGLICVGGDQAFAAGGYRGTPLETTLPVSMELSSKKVLPSGALVLVMHGMEFNNGNQVAREIALAALDALGPQDEMGVLLWDGTEHWLFPLTKASNKKELGRLIAGMNQGDLGNFQNIMSMGHEGLKKSNANLKHMIVFSDGDPAPPSKELMASMVNDRITVSSVLIAGHAGPQTMVSIAEQGKGRFYDVRSPNDLPQIFLKEAAVILKSAIFEEPFKPKIALGSELLRGISAAELPTLLGYVATTPKDRAEIPLVSDKGDPVLAHWQYGLGRAVAFTSDAKAKWARDWLGWAKFRQFWSQATQWSLRKLENADFTTDVSIDKGIGRLTVEAVDSKGNYRNFLDLRAAVVSPSGEPQHIRLEQTGPGHYEVQFNTKEVGSYAVNLMELRDGKVQGSQVLGASVNFSPEYNASEPNLSLLHRLAEVGGGKVLNPSSLNDNSFLHDRQKTFQPFALWEWLLRFAILLFPIDVGIRRIQLDRAEWLKATQTFRRWLFFWKGAGRPAQADESLAALLARRNQVRSTQTAAAQPRADLFQPEHEPSKIDFGSAPSAAPAAVAEPPPKKQEDASSTASKLLEAKRRAQKKPR